MIVNWFRCQLSIMFVMLLFTASQAVLAEKADPDETADSQVKPRIVMVIGPEQDFSGCRELGSVTGQSEESDNEKTLFYSNSMHCLSPGFMWARRFINQPWRVVYQ